MKNPVLLILFLAMFLHSQIARSQFLPFYENKNSSNALQMMNLKGKVKSVQQRTFKAIDSAGIIKKGEKATTLSVTVDGDFDMQFDSTFRTIKEVFKSGSLKIGDTKLIHKYVDGRNMEVIEQYESSPKMLYKYTYKYNSKGKIIEYNASQYFTDNSTFDYKESYKYDTTGNKIECDRFQPSNKPLGKIIYTYYPKQNHIVQEYFDKDGILSSNETFILDNLGRIIDHTAYNNTRRFIFKYDERNNVINKEYYEPADTLVKTFTYKYEYDKKGNWIKRVDYLNRKATFVLERAFEYY